MESFETDIMENGDGEPVIAIDELSGKPEIPTLVLRSENQGIFYRTAHQSVAVTNINPDVYAFLNEHQKILVAEIGQTGVTSTYYADVKKLN